MHVVYYAVRQGCVKLLIPKTGLLGELMRWVSRLHAVDDCGVIATLVVTNSCFLLPVSLRC